MHFEETSSGHTLPLFGRVYSVGYSARCCALLRRNNRETITTCSHRSDGSAANGGASLPRLPYDTREAEGQVRERVIQPLAQLLRDVVADGLIRRREPDLKAQRDRPAHVLVRQVDARDVVVGV